MARAAVAEFGIIQKTLALASVTIYTADANGASTGTKAILYQAATGSASRSNPQTLDTDGKLADAIFVDSDVVAAISNITLSTERAIRKITPNPLEYPLPYTSSQVNVAATAADVVLTNADVVTAAASATTAAEVQAGGIRFNFDTSTSMADPGTGDIRLNNATLSSVTSLAISNKTIDTGNPDISDFIVTWDDSDSTVEGQLIFRKEGATQNFATYNITGSVTDNGAWLQMTLAYTEHAGSFSADDNIIIHFTRTGDKGASGAGSGDLLASNNLSDLVSASTGRTNLGVAIGTDVQIHNADTAVTDDAQSFTAGQRGTLVELTDGATITPNFALANNFYVQLGGNRTLANPTNLVAGQSGSIDIFQDATGSRTLAYGWGFQFAGGSAPTLTTAGASKDTLYYDVQVYSSNTVTITIATPGVISLTAHGFFVGQKVQLTTTGSLPTGLTASTTYFVTEIDANSFSLATSLVNAAAGTRINTTGSQSGTHTLVATSISATLVAGVA